MSDKTNRNDRIADLLSEGKENARTATELSKITGQQPRNITARIEMERGQGAPICADCNRNKGYYLAATPEELQEYCQRRERRTDTIAMTTRALWRAAGRMNRNADKKEVPAEMAGSRQ